MDQRPCCEPCPQPGRWRPRISTQDLACGPIPTRGFDRSWGRSSYSAWIANHATPPINRQDPRSLEEGRDVDARTGNDLNTIPAEAPAGMAMTRTAPSALSPWCQRRGLSPSHPRADFFEQPIARSENEELVQRELSRSGLDTDLTGAVLEDSPRCCRHRSAALWETSVSGTCMPAAACMN